MTIHARHASVRRTLAAVGLSCVLMAGCTSQGANKAPTQPSPGPTAASEWSGGALAYDRDGDIYVADWDGSNPVKIAEGRPPAVWVDGSLRKERCGDGEYWAAGPMWSPDGRYLAYRHHDCDGPLYAWEDVVISDREGNVVTTFPSAGWGISWSPDSTRVAVWIRFGGTIGVYGLDGERQMRLKVPAGFSLGGDHDPMWSPDGESILLPAARWSIPLDGSTPRLLPWVDREGSVVFTYSPDGRLVALWRRWARNSVVKYPDPALVVAEADGSDPRELHGDWQNVVWSPAGDRIAFTSTGHGSTELRVLDVATGATTSVTEFGRRFQLIEFSPQGDRILLSGSRRNGTDWRHSLWSVNVDGSDLRRIVAGTGWGDWSPRP